MIKSLATLLDFILEANNIDPDLGPYCFQLYWLPKQMTEQITVMTDGLRVKQAC